MFRVIFFLIFFSLPSLSFGKDNKLLYFVGDSDRNISERKSDLYVVEQVISAVSDKDSIVAFPHFIELSRDYSKSWNVYDLKKSKTRRQFLNTWKYLSAKEEFWPFIEKYGFSKSERSRAKELEVIAKNISNIRKEHDIDSVYIFIFSNMDYQVGTDTHNKILGDGWITSTESPYRDLVFGSIGRAFQGAKVVMLVEDHNISLKAYLSKQFFHGKLFDQMNANLVWYSRSFPIYGGLSPITGDMLNQIINGLESDTVYMKPFNTEVIELIDPVTGEVEVVNF